ncbi:MAG: hypothetical protein K8Q92_04660 [Methylophilales bacterium]|nr:hypothetical protein [Methylophilales bacterium]
MGYAIAGVLLLLIVLALIYKSVRWLWLKGLYGRLFLVAGFIGVLWSIYDAIYPPESFYISELQRLTKVILPPEAKFLYKTTSYPDIHGDYSACFIVQLSANAAEKLKDAIASEPFHETKISGCPNIDNTLKPLNVMANQYTLSKRATREDVEIFIELIPNQNLAVISWYEW